MSTGTRTLRLLLLSLGAAGCSSLPPPRSVVSPNIRTVAVVGDQPRPVVIGPPGAARVADAPDPSRRPRVSERVSGRVIDASGRPVANARVRLAIAGSRAGKAINDTTDAAGGFTLHGLRPGARYRVIAEAPSRNGLRTGSAVAEAPDRDVVIRLGDSERVSEADDEPSSNVQRASRRRISEAHDPDGEPPPRKVNEEDLPPAGEADEGDPAVASRPQARLPRLAGPVTPTGWHRGRDEPEPPSEAAAPRPAEEPEPDSDPAPTPAPEAAAPPPRASADDADADAGSDANAEEDEEEQNPLPPALERPEAPPSSDEREARVRPAPRRPSRVEEAAEPSLSLLDDGPPARRPPVARSRSGANPPRRRRDALPGALIAAEPPAPPQPPPAPAPREEPLPDPSPAVARAPKPAGPEPASAPSELPEPLAIDSLLTELEQVPTNLTREGDAILGRERRRTSPHPGGSPPPDEARQEPRPPEALQETTPVLTEAKEKPTETEGASQDGSTPGRAGLLPSPLEDVSPPPNGARQASRPPERVAQRTGLEGQQPDGVRQASHPPETPPDLPESRTPEPIATRSDPAPTPTPSPTAPRRPTWRDLAEQPIPAVTVDEPGPTVIPVAHQGPGPDRAGNGSEAGAKAPAPRFPFAVVDAGGTRIADFCLPDLAGRPVRMRDFDADFLLIEFWNSGSAPCVQAIPHLNELHQRFGPGQLQVVGIVYDQGPVQERAATAAAVAHRYGIAYPILLGGVGGPCPLRTSLNVKGLPTLILIDRNGRIVWRGQGTSGFTLSHLNRIVAQTAGRPGIVRR